MPLATPPIHAVNRSVPTDPLGDKRHAMHATPADNHLQHTGLYGTILAGRAVQRGGCTWHPDHWTFVHHFTRTSSDGTIYETVRSRGAGRTRTETVPRFVATFGYSKSKVLTSVDVFLYNIPMQSRLLMKQTSPSDNVFVGPAYVRFSRSAGRQRACQRLDSIIMPLGSRAARGMASAVLPNGIEQGRIAIDALLTHGTSEPDTAARDAIMLGLSMVSRAGVLVHDGAVVNGDPRAAMRKVTARKLMAAVKSKGVYWRWREFTARKRFHPSRMRDELQAHAIDTIAPN
jgi:hypothetical protein